MDTSITLADGTKIESAECLETDGNLFLYFYGAFSMQTLFDAFYDADKTAVIKADRFGVKSTYEGYTHLKALREEETGKMYTIAMRKEP